MVHCVSLNLESAASKASLLAICVILVVLLVATITIAIAASLLAMYFARWNLRMHCLACKAHCRKKKQPSLSFNYQASQSVGSEVEVGMYVWSGLCVCVCVRACVLVCACVGGLSHCVWLPISCVNR